MAEQKKKERLDVLLVKRALAPSREQAKALIMTGNVFVDGKREDKAGSNFYESAQIEVRSKAMRYVSRGGYKLEKALQVFDLSVTKKICMDVGSSTGGFTDCMLQNGAKKVYAVDVGTNQLAWKLRQDNRVVCMEKTNIRYLTPEKIPEKIAFASVDVAFISLTKVLLPVRQFLEEDAKVVCLVKPQFEAGKDKVGKKGVVRDKDVHLSVIKNVAETALFLGFSVEALDFSPIRGPEGNIEYLLEIKNGEKECDLEQAQEIYAEKFLTSVEQTVTLAHKQL